MKLLLSFVISFFFICFSANLDLSGVGDEYFQIDKKTAVNNSRFVTSQKVVQKKKLHPESWVLEFLKFSTADILSQNGFLAVYSYLEISNYVSSGAKIYQEITSA